MDEEMVFIDLKEVMRRCGRSRTALYEDIKKKEFPAPFKIARRSARWLQSDIVEWQLSKLNGQCENSLSDK